MADLQRKTANLFNVIWESGSLGASGGAIADTNAIRTKSPISCEAEKIYTFVPDIDGYDSIWVNYYGTTNSRERIDTSGGTFTTPQDCEQVRFRVTKTNIGVEPVQQYNAMLNEGQTALPYEPYGWLHSLRKLTTATEAVENPLYTDGTAITAYTIKGNTVQDGTPSPSNPVAVNGVGERTENLFNVQNYVANITTHSCTVSAAANGVKITATGSDAYAGEAYKSPDGANSGDSQAAIPVEENTLYALSADVDTFTDCYISYLDSSYKALNANYTKIGADVPATFTTPTGTAYVALRLGSKSLGVGQSKTFANITLTKNGLYKIPISNGQQTTNIYLGSTQTVRQIKKYVFDGTESGWYKNTASANPWFQNDLFEIAIPSAQGYCTHLEYKQIIASTPDIGWYITQTNNQFRFRLPNSADMSLDDFKNWLEINKPTIWFVLATPQTATLDEPLMKIGDYADTLSNVTAIPTTEGANSITVDTTVQPSEFTATWTGWHNASVKEKSENLFNERIAGTFISTSGVIESNATYDVAVIPVIAGEQYTFAYKQDYSQNYVIAYYTTKPVVGSTSYDSSRIVYIYTDTPQVTVTVPNGVTYIAIRLPSNGDIMLNAGSTAKPYEPYWK